MSVSSLPSQKPKQPLLSDRLYDVLKRVATIFLPAATTLYFALDQVWHFPHAVQIMGTITAVNTAVGALVHVSSSSYNNTPNYVGALEVSDTGEKKTYTLNLDVDPESLDQLPEATFKVTPVPPSEPASEPVQPGSPAVQ